MQKKNGDKPKKIEEHEQESGMFEEGEVHEGIEHDILCWDCCQEEEDLR